jgi:hypothetical protein
MKLSKSLYTRAIQCQKSLWLKKHNKDVLTPPNAAAQAIFENGNEVGDLACKLFPNGVEIPYLNTTFQDKINLTQEYINQGTQNIYEATFEFDGILIMIDILNIKDNSVIINEVKSSTLDLIHNGGEAMEAFANLSKIDDDKLKQRYRDSLLEYCKLDTLAMVKILEKLKEYFDE